jgi:hypothetical protein
MYITYQIHRKFYQKLRKVIRYQKEFASPLEKVVHPDLDTSELFTTEQVAHYQSMIGSLQWIVTIGRFYIHTAVMTMSGFRIALRIRHLEQLRHIYGYL